MKFTRHYVIFGDIESFPDPGPVAIEDHRTEKHFLMRNTLSFKKKLFAKRRR